MLSQYSDRQLAGRMGFRFWQEQRVFSLELAVLPSTPSSDHCSLDVKPCVYSRPGCDTLALFKFLHILYEENVGTSYRERTFYHRCLDRIWAARTLLCSRDRRLRLSTCGALPPEPCSLHGVVFNQVQTKPLLYVYLICIGL